MKDTIKAENGYRVVYLRNKETKEKTGFAKVYDGNNCLMIAEIRSYEDYEDEVINQNNEMATLYEVFTTTKENQFLYWRDIETDEDFITKIEK